MKFNDKTDNKEYSSIYRQKLTYTEKSKNDFEWAKKCADNFIKEYGLFSSSGKKRSSFHKKQRNYNLYNGVFDKDDMNLTIEPFGLKGMKFPAEIQYRDIVSPIFNLLFGEEIKRGTSFVVKSINEDAISSKENKKKEMILQVLQEQIINENPDKDPEKALKEIEKYFTFEYQDIKERTNNHLLNYLYRYLKLDQEFNKGFEDALLAGEEIYESTIISKEPITRRLNPQTINFKLSQNSDKLDDCDLIVIDEFLPIGQVIDEYWEQLDNEEISEIENSYKEGDSFNGNDFNKRFIKLDDTPPENDTDYNYNDKGFVRVTKCIWKSRKKIGELTYQDEHKEIQKDYVDETYKLDEERDISIDWFWINEYWEVHRIKDCIYKNIGPRKLQFRKSDNISYCQSGFVGTVYNCNNSESISLMDRLVPWIYLYVTIWYRTELLIAANQGKIAIIDLSLVPDGWEVEKWLYYASMMKFAFVDSYNEGSKGERMGKLNQSTQNRSIDMETGNTIQHNISLLDYIERKIHDVSGVSQQRLGSIYASEGVGNVQKSVTQSAIITEKLFQVHNWTKQRVLTQLLEVAKVAYSENNKKLQYITDDLGTIFFEYDGFDMSNEECGVFVSDSIKDQMTMEFVKQWAHAALQNDKTEFSSIIDIASTNSLGDIKAKLKEAEQKAIEREDKILAAEQERSKMEMDLRNRELQMKNWNEQENRNTKLRVAEIQALGMEKGDSSDIVEQTKLALAEREQAFKEQQSINQDNIDNKKNELKEREITSKEKLKKEEIASKERQHKEKIKSDKNKKSPKK